MALCSSAVQSCMLQIPTHLGILSLGRYFLFFKFNVFVCRHSWHIRDDDLHSRYPRYISLRNRYSFVVLHLVGCLARLYSGGSTQGFNWPAPSPWLSQSGWVMKAGGLENNSTGDWHRLVERDTCFDLTTGDPDRPEGTVTSDGPTSL